MRRVLVAMIFMTGCGGFLPFFGDDDEPVPPPVVIDAASDATVFDASGGADAQAQVDADAGSDAGSDAGDLLAWRCTTQPPSAPYASENDCNGARLAQNCDSVNEPPNELPCEPLGAVDTFCGQACQKTDPSITAYSYAVTQCTCSRQP